MKTLFRNIVLMLLILLINANVAKAVDTPFTDISLTTAKEIAAAEGKFIFVDFYANWCVPCKWMDETTYSDNKVIETLNSNFIPVKVNIDDFDGYNLKEEYDVKVLPTVLVMDQNGRIIKRFEESLPASKLKAELENITGKTPDNYKNMGTNMSPKHSIDKNNPENIVTVKTNKLSYRVQVGVFSDYANTEKMLTKLYDNFNEPVVVLTSYLDNKTVYKVYVGDFETESQAIELKNEIESKLNIKCLVKSFE